jgi:dihydroneopterin aldolase
LDRIAIRGIRAYGRHGADAGERERVQPFDIDVAIELDLSRAASTDASDDTVDYASLAWRLTQIVESTSFALLERLARDLLEAVFEDERVALAEVTVGKPGILGGATPSVTLRRRR